MFIDNVPADPWQEAEEEDDEIGEMRSMMLISMMKTQSTILTKATSTVPRQRIKEIQPITDRFKWRILRL